MRTPKKFQYVTILMYENACMKVHQPYGSHQQVCFAKFFIFQLCNLHFIARESCLLLCAKHFYLKGLRVIQFNGDMGLTLSIKNNLNILSNYLKNVHSIACTMTPKTQPAINQSIQVDVPQMNTFLFAPTSCRL